MAGDWIKLRIDLGDDPAVICMASTLETDEDAIVGKLHRLWSWADRHATNGFAIGINSRWVDRYVNCPKFADAMVSVEWLHFCEKGVTFPNFDRHNGKSAKTRCDAALRQRLSRKERDSGVTSEERTGIPRPFRSAILKRDNYTCGYCGAESTASKEASRKSVLSIDHIIPATRGGRSSMDNMLTCCKLCNMEKTDRTPEEWGLLPTFLSDGVTYASQKICDISVTKPLQKALPEKRREEKRVLSNDNTSAETQPIGWSSADGWFGISDRDREEWNVAYPTCDINRQLAAMEQWLKANPARAKKSAWRRFVTNWLSREQERGGDMRGGKSKLPPLPPKAGEIRVAGRSGFVVDPSKIEVDPDFDEGEEIPF